MSVRLTLEVGPKAVVRTAHRLGIASKLEPNASIALGTSEVSVMELVSAYVPFANGGIAVAPHVIERVRTAGGKLIYRARNPGLGRVIDERHAAMMNQMMQETLASGTAHKAALAASPAAGKTGTSQDFRDAWFVGYTGHLVTGVWLGNDDNSPTKKMTGGGLPVEVWTPLHECRAPGPADGRPARHGGALLRSGAAADAGAGDRAAKSAHLDARARAGSRAVQPRGRHAPADPGRTAAPAGRGRAAGSARARSGTRDAATSAAGRGRAALRRPPAPTPRVTPPPRASPRRQPQYAPATQPGPPMQIGNVPRPPAAVGARRAAPAADRRERRRQASETSSAICSGSAEGGVHPHTPSAKAERPSSSPNRR